MFLDRLTKEEKILFLDLASYASQCNGIVDNLENDLLYQYTKEIGIESYDYSEAHHTLEDITANFSVVSEAKKRIIVLELLGICCIDGDYDNIEKAFVSDFATNIGIDEKTLQKLNHDINEYITILGIMEDHIEE